MQVTLANAAHWRPAASLSLAHTAVAHCTCAVPWPQIRTILRHCSVFSEEDFREQAPKGDDVFFCRSLYDESLHRFVPLEQHEDEEGGARWDRGEDSADEGHEAWAEGEDDAASRGMPHKGRQAQGRGRRGPRGGASLGGPGRPRGRGKRGGMARGLGRGRPLPPLAPELHQFSAPAHSGARLSTGGAGAASGEAPGPLSAAAALNSLHLSSVPAALPCREK